MDFQFTFNLTDLLNLLIAFGALIVSYCTWDRQNKKDKANARRSLKVDFKTEKKWFLVSVSGTSYYHSLVVSIVNDCQNPISLLKGELMILGSEGGISKIFTLNGSKLKNKTVLPGELLQVGFKLDDIIKKHVGSRIRIRIYDTFEKTYLSEIDIFTMAK